MEGFRLGRNQLGGDQLGGRGESARSQLDNGPCSSYDDWVGRHEQIDAVFVLVCVVCEQITSLK